jgi:hypothetical protein
MTGRQDDRQDDRQRILDEYMINLFIYFQDEVHAADLVGTFKRYKN